MSSSVAPNARGYSAAGTPLSNPVVAALRSELDVVSKQAEDFFDKVSVAVIEKRANLANLANQATRDWQLLTEEQQRTSHEITQQVVSFSDRLVDAIRKSPLMESTDVDEARRLIKSMSSALHMKLYVYRESYVVSEEDRVYGIQPAEQEEHAAPVESCKYRFLQDRDKILAKMDLLSPTPENLPLALGATQTPGIVKSRLNTAFIIMQIDPANSKLEDVKNSIKEVFKKFGIEARRSDEIEHSDTITERILDEIKTCEFLIADLSGERPSVYYEVGYAHAIGKRPILYRGKGEHLHFDLAGVNVPEYENLTDLKDKLSHRLASMTGKNL